MKDKEIGVRSQALPYHTQNWQLKDFLGTGKEKTNPKIITSWMQRVCDDAEKEKMVNKYHPSTLFKNNRDDLFYYARMIKHFFVS